MLIDGDLVIPDSTVICEYLDDRYPDKSLYPADPAQRARARWLEEFADSRLGDVMIWKLFFQRNVQTAMAVGQARAVALLVAAHHALPVDEPTPNEVKQAVCGNGAADKQQVATMVQRLLSVTLTGAADDATDALAAAIGCLYRAAAQPASVEPAARAWR